MSRLEQLEELIEALRPIVLAEHTEHGLQGLSGLVGQYRAALKEAEDLRALTIPKGTALDEFTRRRTERQASGSPRPAVRQQRGR